MITSTNPYQILGVTKDADDACVRKAYLSLVRKYPPDTHPDRFEKINEAYETLKDEKSRLRYYLFQTDPGIGSPFEALFMDLLSVRDRKPPGFDAMKAYLRKCAMG